MSDPSLPSSSPSSSRSNSSLAFLVHSQTTVANDLPPNIDNKSLARQKRRRTSKEDEEILRAEYLKNPKPDKAARMEIVSKVALGEKEVQIWFQNKRQNDRRRSRPLDTSSTVSLMSSSSTMSDPATEDDTHVPEHEHEHEHEQEVEHEEIEEQNGEASNPEDLEPTEKPEDTVTETPVADPAEAGNLESQNTVESIAVASTDPPTADTALTEPSGSQQTLPSSQGTSQPRTSWISNRRSASFMRYNEEHVSENISFATASLPTTESSSSTRSLKRTHSFVRLSMTDDGTARVITDADKTPSPPHAKSNPAHLSRAAAGLRRSFSAAEFSERLSAVSRGEPSPKIPRTSSIGRSRDSRAWEFWCDPDSRYNTSLTTRAEQEGSGSAADAIGLLRANRRALGQNKTRQNTPVLSRNESKVLGEQGIKKSRKPMQRASTSYGRLQTKVAKEIHDGGDSDELPQTESDKENWEPEIPQSRRLRQPGPPIASQRPRQILGENTEIMSQSSSLGAMLAKEKGKDGRKRARENTDPEQDEELRMFMHDDGLSGRTSLNSAEEAGCVEGLLKLSQGNWK